MEGNDEYGDLRQLLNDRCSGSVFSDEDLQKLAGQGYTTEVDFRLASREGLLETLPGRRAKVDVLLNAFGATAAAQANEEMMTKINIQLAAIIEALRPKKSFKISEACSTVWRAVSKQTGLHLEDAKRVFDATMHTERDVPEFVWAESVESAQAGEYLSYISRELLKLNENWAVINGNSYPTLLNTDLGGMEFKGTADVAVVLQAARTLPATGLKIIFELRKVGKTNQRAEYQTIVALVLANTVCGHYRPVAMLSDLGEKWIFFWMDGLIVHRHEFATRSLAVGYLDFILKDDVEPEDRSHDIDALLKRSFLGRQEFRPPEMERLEELACFLSEDELRQDRAAIALQYVLNMPGFSSVVSDMRESSQPFFEGMYL